MAKRTRRTASKARLRRGVLYAAAALISAVAALHLWWAGHLIYWKYQPPEITRFMEQRQAALIARGASPMLYRRWLPYEAISPHLKRAVVAAEDDRFMQHGGFDWKALQRAMEKNLERGRIAAGGSTITNQLAKNLFLTPARTPWRKLQEASITVLMEWILGKRRILEIYLNSIEWGQRAWGAEAAARHYFGVGADRLTAEQAGLLAALIPNPRHYDRVGITEHLRAKARLLLQRMEVSKIP